MSCYWLNSPLIIVQLRTYITSRTTIWVFFFFDKLTVDSHSFSFWLVYYSLVSISIYFNSLCQQFQPILNLLSNHVCYIRVLFSAPRAPSGLFITNIRLNSFSSHSWFDWCLTYSQLVFPVAIPYSTYILKAISNHS